MTISQDNSKKLFQVSVVFRHEQSIDNSERLRVAVNVITSKSQIENQRVKVNFFLEVFSKLKDEYQIVTDVLMKRVTNRNISKPIGNISDNDHILHS